MYKAKRYLVVLIFFMLTLGLYVQDVQAVPALTKEKTFTQPDGTTFIGKLWGDEWLSGYETKDNYTIIKDKKSGYWYYADVDSNMQLISNGVAVGKGIPNELKPNIRPEKVKNIENRMLKQNNTKPLATVSSIGTAKFPVLLVNFQDTSSTYGASDFNRLLFGTGSGGVVSGPGTLKDYYREVSNNKFNIDGVVSNWYTAKNNHDFYGENHGSNYAALLVKEAVEALDASIDFSQFDNNGDGKVDNLIVIHQGLGAEVGDTTSIWSHNWSLSDAGVGAIVADGKTIDTYTIQPEKYDNNTMVGIGVFAHETGHALGLPDLYDIDGSSEGVGDWCLMSGGSWGATVHEGDTPVQLSAWCKSKLGWLTPQVISNNTLKKQIEPIESSPNEVYQILNNPRGIDWSFDNHSGAGEYFLIENRQKLKFDAALPGTGLLIWHIDESVTYSNDANTDEQGRRLVSLEQADGRMNLEYGYTNRGDPGDPYPGISQNRNFNNTSKPDSNLYDGSDSNVSLSNITSINNIITLDIDLEEKNTNIYLQSNHPYEDELDYTWQYTLPGNPQNIEVTFDPRTIVEDYCDNIYIMDKNDNLIENGKFTGTALQGRTISVPGDTVKVRLTSDYTAHYWGFAIIGVSGISLNKNELAMKIGDRMVLKATMIQSSLANSQIVWQSSDENIALVDNKGNVTAIGNGKAIIYAKSAENNQLSAQCNVTINTPVIGIKLSNSSVNLSTLENYNTVQLSAIITPDNAMDKTVTWISDNPNIAIVDKNGLVTAVSKGKANIVVKTSNETVSAQCAITVTPVETIILKQSTLTLVVGKVTTLNAQVMPLNAFIKEISWKSSDEAIVTVDSTGKLKALKNGQATVTVTTKDGGHTASCKVVVVKTVLTSIKLDKPAITLNTTTKNNYKLISIITPSNADYADVTFTSSDLAVATVSEDGIVTAVKAGTAKIIAKTLNGGKIAACKVNVVPVNSVEVSGRTSMKVGEAQVVSAIIKPTNAADKYVTWTSSDENIAIVTKYGKLIAIREGTIIVKATSKDGGLQGTFSVKILPVKDEVKISDLNLIKVSSKSIAVGERTNIIAKFATETKNRKPTNTNLLWTSSDESVATVDDRGEVTTIGVGTTTITAKTTDGSNIEKTCSIVVVKAISNVVIDKSNVILKLSNTKEQVIKLNIFPTDATNPTINWSTSNYVDIAQIGEMEVDGSITIKITAKAKGSTKINFTISTANGSSRSVYCSVIIM